LEEKSQVRYATRLRRRKTVRKRNDLAPLSGLAVALPPGTGEAIMAALFFMPCPPCVRSSFVKPATP